MNLAETLLAAGLEHHTALECGERKLSYGELRGAVRRAAGAWQQLGLQDDQRVLVFAPDGIDWVVAYLGAIAAGGVAVGLNSRLFEQELGIVLAESGARFVWCEADALPLLTRLCSGVEHQPPEFVVGGSADSDWASRLAQAPPRDAAARRPEDMALWIYTSGTTGSPKAVVHAQRAVDGCAAFAQHVLRVTPADRLYATSKLFFAYPLANSLFAGLKLGATVILDGEWPTARRAAEICERHRPSVLFCVPTLYHKIVQGDLVQRVKAAGVRQYVSAGESLPALVRQALEESSGAPVLSGFGTSETMCLMLYAADADGILRPAPMAEIRDDFATAGKTEGIPRRLWIRHPSVALGYWRLPAQTQADFAAGWFSPGDLFVPHGVEPAAWGFSGRTDDMLKISGQWVSTIAVDQALLAACGDSVQELGSVAARNAQGLAEIAIFVVPAEGRAEDARLKLSAGIEALPGFKRPRRIRFVDSLPRTATGKLQRNKLAGWLQEP